MTKRIGTVAVFLVGCAVGGVSSQLVVPKASAQQAATLTKWEMYCTSTNGIGDIRDVPAAIAKQGTQLGAEGWEFAGSNPGTWCWKRPKM